MTARSLVPRLLLVAALCVLLGWGGILDPTHAVLLGLVLIAAVLLRAGRSDPSEAEWPEHASGGRPGGRNSVSDLAWQVYGRDGRVSGRIVERTRDLAIARLTLLGIDASDPAEVERMLGARVAAGLVSNAPPTARTLQTWCDAIDRLTDERTTR